MRLLSFNLRTLPIYVGLFTTVHAFDLTITNDKTVTIPKTLGGGYMWEDINHSGDGGLYAELLQNRAFQAVTPGTAAALAAWEAIGTNITVVNNIPGVSTALPNSLAVSVPSSAGSKVGFQNTGYWGIKVQKGWTYKGSFYAKSTSYRGSITVSLKSTSGTTYATKTLSNPTLNSNYQKYSFTLAPSSSAPDAKNVFVVELDGASAKGATVHFGMFSLFPPTYKNRPNGMRIDLAEAMASSKPSVWRFPGGNNLEGLSFDTRWKWNETIGPLENRPGRLGNWGYPNTDGLGLLEYLDWAEDINTTVILGVWSGLAIGNPSTIVPKDQLQPYIDDAIAQIEFITADAKTNKWGALRASLGREKPYELRYIEIGNEDQFAEPSYQAYRWNMFVTQLSAKFPDKKFIATSYPSLALDPAYLFIDYHNYNTPGWFQNASFMFDNYPRNGTQYFVGEYAVISTNQTDLFGEVKNGRLAYPTLQGAVAEAAFMTGMERNSDVVFAAAYAPTLQHINGYQWTPDIITFDASTLVKSTSHYAQQMFSETRGTHVLSTIPVSTKATAPLYWVASVNELAKQVILKVANAGNNTVAANITLEFTASGKAGTVVSLTPGADGRADVYNTLTSPNTIVPKTAALTGISVNAASVTSSFSYSFVGNSVSVITIPTK